MPRGTGSPGPRTRSTALADRSGQSAETEPGQYTRDSDVTSAFTPSPLGATDGPDCRRAERRMLLLAAQVCGRTRATTPHHLAPYTLLARCRPGGRGCLRLSSGPRRRSTRMARPICSSRCRRSCSCRCPTRPTAALSSPSTRAPPTSRSSALAVSTRLHAHTRLDGTPAPG